VSFVEVKRFAEASKWDRCFLQWATRAADMSKDPRKKVGALLVSPDRRTIAYGYNGFPRGLADDERLEDKTKKNLRTVHAELNAVLNARTDLTGWTLYCTSAPCHDCAKALCQTGIARVVTVQPAESSSWSGSIHLGTEMLNECGVSILWVTQYDYL